MNVKELIAIDVHTHAEVSCRQPHDPAWQPYDEAASKYFKVGKRPTIAETIAYYRERRIGLVMFTVDSEFQIGAKRMPIKRSPTPPPRTAISCWPSPASIRTRAKEAPPTIALAADGAPGLLTGAGGWGGCQEGP